MLQSDLSGPPPALQAALPKMVEFAPAMTSSFVNSHPPQVVVADRIVSKDEPQVEMETWPEFAGRTTLCLLRYFVIN